MLLINTQGRKMFMQMFSITLEKILTEFSISELENIVFKNEQPVEHFLHLAEIEANNYKSEAQIKKNLTN
jgi:hypothetical protein